jgi:antitoxin HicB
VTDAYLYPAAVEPDEAGRLVVSFRDVPEALTDGATLADALTEAEGALVAALAGYVDDARRPRPLPRPSRPQPGKHPVAVPVLVAAKLALHEAMREAGLNGAGLARRLDLPETAVRRLLDLRHRSHIEQVALALAQLGKRVALKVSGAK